MGIEIERKYLVQVDKWDLPEDGKPVVQGYICEENGRTLRVRMLGEKGILTIKGPTQGATRAEFEYEIPAQDASELLEHCEGRIVRKTRYKVTVASHIWDVDVFEGENAPLVLAEVELGHEEEPFEAPDWLGSEVTGDPRYMNYQLACEPYGGWER